MTTAPSAPSRRRFTAFRCPEPLLGALQSRAQDDGRTLSNLIVHLLTRELNPQPRQKQRPNG